MDFLRKNSRGGVIKYIKLGNLTELQIPLQNLYKLKIGEDRLCSCR